MAQVWELRTPKNISYFWGFGRLLGVFIAVQIISGIFLSFYYVRGSRAWESIVSLTREVSWGWIARVFHSNIASFVFIILFLHYFRGIVQGSFYLSLPWVRGWSIKALTIAAAFLGYVLPWGQISFWGATVIINLLRVLPKGGLLVIWLWGGFYVSSFTCSFFYRLHYLVPFIIVFIMAFHLVLLHFRGRRTPRGLPNPSFLKMKFNYLFTFKDTVNLRLFLIVWLLILISPDWSADPVNFVSSDLSNSPLDIQPEWYFLHLYAVLRSIPNKLGGLVAFVFALVALLLLILVKNTVVIANFKVFNYIVWVFISINLLLLWLGIQPVEAPYIFIGQIITILYFVFFIEVYTLDFFLHTLL